MSDLDSYLNGCYHLLLSQKESQPADMQDDELCVCSALLRRSDHSV